MDTTLPEPKLVIYGLRCTCHPEKGVRYVGRTIQGAAKRFYGHRASAKSGDILPVYKWMRKHGVENVYYEILAVAGFVEDLPNLECKWIEKLSPTGLLMNMTTAEQGVYKISEVTRARMSESGKRKLFSTAQRARMSESQRGRIHSVETRAKMSAWQKGRTLTPEHCASISAARLGKKRGPQSEEHRKNLSAAGVGKHSGNVNPGAKLTDFKVSQVLDLLHHGFSQSWIAKQYEVSASVVCNISNGTAWAHVPRLG